MTTNINTTNAIKGLTCAIERLKHLEKVLHINANDPIQHLVIAATEIDRLNSENIKLRSETDKLKGSINTAAQDGTERFRKRWDVIVDTVAATDAGRGLLRRGMGIDIVTDKAVAVINKTEADHKEALRIAAAFQKAKSESHTKKHLFDALNYATFASFIPAYDALTGIAARRAGRTTISNYHDISTEIIGEAIRATLIHPKWPTDALHAVSILTEESGELMKAAIEFHYNNGDIEAVREEAVQTGAMALRVLMHIDKYKRPSDEK